MHFQESYGVQGMCKICVCQCKIPMGIGKTFSITPRHSYHKVVRQPNACMCYSQAPLLSEGRETEPQPQHT